jgi:hypothetical protein
MPYEKIEVPFEDGTPIKLVKLVLGRSWYAAGPVNVFMGGSKLNFVDPAWAVMYHDGASGKTDKHINLQPYAKKWLGDRWLNPVTTDLLMDLAAVLCAPDAPPPVPEQVIAGDYLETIEKIRDEVLAGIKEGSIKDRRTMRERLCHCVDNSVYAEDYEMGLVALKHAAGKPTGQVRRLVKSTMYDMVSKQVFETAEFRKLPKKAVMA